MKNKTKSESDQFETPKNIQKTIKQFQNSEDSPFYLQEPYVYLINPGLLPKNISMVMGFPVGKILPQFVDKMKENNEGVLDFRILGAVLYQTVKIHKSKIDIVIKHQQKEEIKAEKKRIQQEFDSSKILPYWYNRPQLILASEKQKSVFFEELLSAFEEIEQFEIKKQEKKRRFRLRRQKKKDGDEDNPKKSKRRKLTADAISQFDYIMNFDLTEVDTLTNEMLEIIIIAMKKGFFQRKRKEISFLEVVKTRIKRMSKKNKINFDRAQLERVRSLLGLLYLIQDHLVEAWQDEETFEIGISPLQKAYDLHTTNTERTG